jgi:methanogenic corrinoid protein MtbC1
VQGGRRGQPRQAGQLDVRAIRVGLQRTEQLYVNFVKFNSHLTIDYEAKTAYWPNSVYAGATMAA